MSTTVTIEAAGEVTVVETSEQQATTIAIQGTVINTGGGGGSIVTTTDQDIEITDYTKGLIRRTQDGTRVRETLVKDVDGNITAQYTVL